MVSERKTSSGSTPGFSPHFSYFGQWPVTGSRYNTSRALLQAHSADSRVSYIPNDKRALKRPFAFSTEPLGHLLARLNLSIAG
jgi:hypothetical protein